jgi:hypothetical protein
MADGGLLALGRTDLIELRAPDFQGETCDVSDACPRNFAERVFIDKRAR